MASRLAACPLSLIMAALAFAQTPKFTNFTIPGSTEIRTSGINAAGTIVGCYVVQNGDNGTVYGYLRTLDGAITQIQYPNSAGDTEAVAVNESGAVAGFYNQPDYVYHGFVLSPAGAFTTFDAPGAAEIVDAGTWAQGMNSAGDIVGYYLDANSIRHGFVRYANGPFQTIDAPGAGAEMFLGTEAYAINDGGAIMGSFSGVDSGGGFIRFPKGMIATFQAPTSGSISPRAMNVHGDIAGFYTDSGASGITHGFIRAIDGTMTTFDAPPTGPGATNTVATGINDQGMVTGWLYGANFVVQGFFRTPGGKFSSFNAPQSHQLGLGTYPFLINDAGVIAGYFSVVGPYAFVLTP